MRVAIVHYWLVSMRGGEKVIESICDLFPEADIFTHVYDPLVISKKIKAHKIKTSFIQNLPFARRYYQSYLPFMPLALEQLDLRGYDLVISSESGPAKGVITDPDSLHVCYCHSPMRYLWDMYHDYRERAGFFKRLLMPVLTHKLRQWDCVSASRVDEFISNSGFVRKRINKFYRRDAHVIYPPVSVSEFGISEKVENYYLMAGQLTHYKQPQLAIEVFNKLNRPLIVIGEGELTKELKKMANDNISFLGKLPFSVMRDYFAKCKALIFPGTEDFGIIPVEVMASGRPVIAYKKGGAEETIIEHQTGMFFHEQSSSALYDAVVAFEKISDSFSQARIREHAEQFSEDRFKNELGQFINLKLSQR